MTTKILVVDDERAIREILSDAINKAGYDVVSAATGEEALSLAQAQDLEIAICDIKMPGMSGLELLQKIHDISPETVVIMITAYASVDTAVKALRNGAFDYILKPLIFEDVLAKISRIDKYRRIKRENLVLRQEVEKQYDFHNIIARSRAMEKVFEMVRKVSTTTSNILITGESGTGKELIARAIHFNSPMKEEKFVPLNCGAIPTNLWESELFGHVRGAFTGASRYKEGYFQTVEQGTLFLDEVSEIPLDAQVKLLRVLEDQAFTPLGSVTPKKTNARIIAASNQPLKQKVEQKTFRDDLYYRLNVIEIDLPPLRERKEDLPALVLHFVGQYNRELGKNIQGVDNGTMRLLLSYDWKGNVRELKNVIERALILCDSEIIGVQDLPAEFQKFRRTSELMGRDLKQSMKDFEKISIISVLEQVSYDKKKAASILGLSKSSFYRKIEELGIGTSPDPSQK